MPTIFEEARERFDLIKNAIQLKVDVLATVDANFPTQSGETDVSPHEALTEKIASDFARARRLIRELKSVGSDFSSPLKERNNKHPDTIEGEFRVLAEANHETS